MIPPRTKSDWNSGEAGVLVPGSIAVEANEGPEASDGLLDATDAVLFALARAVEHRDQITADHCERMALTSLAMGMALSLETKELVALFRGAYLHDIGKVGIPDAILFKPGRLTHAEWELMCTHTTLGVEICRHLKTLEPSLGVIRHHHEHWDGSGYPDRLAGTDIPLLARIVQISDIYDALTSPRPYKRAFAPAEAIATLEEETSKGWRDPELITVFLRLHRNGLDAVTRNCRLDSLRTMFASIASHSNLWKNENGGPPNWV